MGAFDLQRIAMPNGPDVARMPSDASWLAGVAIQAAIAPIPPIIARGDDRMAGDMPPGDMPHRLMILRQ